MDRISVKRTMYTTLRASNPGLISNNHGIRQLAGGAEVSMSQHLKPVPHVAPGS